MVSKYIFITKNSEYDLTIISFPETKYVGYVLLSKHLTNTKFKKSEIHLFFINQWGGEIGSIISFSI